MEQKIAVMEELILDLAEVNLISRYYPRMP